MTTEADGRALTTREDIAPSFVVRPEEIGERIRELQAFVANYLKEGEDFGTIPGTPKPTLFKPGAEKLCDVYGFQRKFEVTSRLEDWDKPLFHYEVRADLVSLRNGLLIAQGFGSANSREGRYRYRDANRKCPECGKESIIKGKAEYGGGWLCWKKKDGCGATFQSDDPVITSQPAGKVENEDIFTLVNTLLKMAKKRALVDAVLSATRSSGIFTQDVEDFIDGSARVVEDVPARGEDSEHMKPPKGGQVVMENKAKLAGYMTANKLKAVDVLRLLGHEVADGTEARSMWDAHIETLQKDSGLSEDEAYATLLKDLGAL